LGLAISKAYVEILGGKNMGKSEEGNGSVLFYYPISI
jgi:signal transduction histidine kinase